MNKHAFLYFFSLLLVINLISCSSGGNSETFIGEFEGRYLYNSDEVIECYFENEELFLKWRGATSIKPLKTGKNEFYVKEMNEKIRFESSAGTNKARMIVISKDDTKTDSLRFDKLGFGEKIPNEMLMAMEFQNATEAYLSLQVTDSLDPAIDENRLNRKGYSHLRSGETEIAVAVFRINSKLHPASSNVYDSLGEGLLKIGDTISAIESYKKSLELDPSNNRARKIIEDHDK